MGARRAVPGARLRRGGSGLFRLTAWKTTVDNRIEQYHDAVRRHRRLTEIEKDLKSIDRALVRIETLLRQRSD